MPENSDAFWQTTRYWATSTKLSWTCFVSYKQEHFNHPQSQRKLLALSLKALFPSQSLLLCPPKKSASRYTRETFRPQYILNRSSVYFTIGYFIRWTQKSSTKPNYPQQNTSADSLPCVCECKQTNNDDGWLLPLKKSEVTLLVLCTYNPYTH